MNVEMIQLTPVPCSIVARGVPSTLAAVCSASPAHWTTASRPQGKQKDCGVEQWRGASPTVSGYRLKQASRQHSTASAHCLTLWDGPLPPAPSYHCTPTLDDWGRRHTGICVISGTVWHKMTKAFLNWRYCARQSMMGLSSGKHFNSVLTWVLFQQMKPFPKSLLCLGKLLLTEFSDNNIIKFS